MKLKALATICKQNSRFCLIDRIDPKTGEAIEQWLGNGNAAFPLYGMPTLTEDNIPVIFDITEKQLEKIHITQTAASDGINFTDTDKKEILLEREKTTMGYAGRVVRPLLTSTGLVFIDDDYLSPLADVADELELYERHDTSGGIYITAKVGLMIAGVILPLNIIDEKLVDYMETLAAKCRAALNMKGGE
jgi:hypothetical protein